MTKAFRPPRLPKKAGVTLEQPPTDTSTHRESDDNYQWVAATLAADLRVILCKNGLQYIPQRRYADGLRGGVWRSLHYCAFKASLIRVCEGLESLSGPVSTAPLAALPEKARDRGKK
jgi:hypothetical protein